MQYLYVLRFALFCAHSLHASPLEPFRQLNFSIIKHSIYIPQISSSFITNLTGKFVTSAIVCAAKCLSSETCQTSVFYKDPHVCSLFNERSSIGEIRIVINQASSVIATTKQQSQNAAVNSIPFNATWSFNSTVIIGDPLGTAGPALNRLNLPAMIFYDEFKKEIIVADSYNYRVIKFSRYNSSAYGKIIAGGNGLGSSLNQFIFVFGVILDSNRQLYASDRDNNRIVKFPADSNSSVYGTLVGTINQPYGLAIDRRTDDIYVCSGTDYLVMKLVKNSTVGIVVAGGNGNGNNLNQFSLVYFIYFDDVATNALYVADQANNRILKFAANSTSSTSGKIVAGTGTNGVTANQLSNPYSVTVDMNGILYIADGSGRIQRWLPNATRGDTIASGLVGSPGYFRITQVIFDENHYMIAVEGFNNRIRAYNITKS